MWIFLNNSFLSIVDPGSQGPKRGDNLLVRARVKGDIERVFPKAKVEETVKRDYRFRAFIDRKLVAQALANQILDIGYTNFKSSISEATRHHACADVWGTMFRLQGMLGGRSIAEMEASRPKARRLFPDDDAFGIR